MNFEEGKKISDVIYRSMQSVINQSKLIKSIHINMKRNKHLPFRACIRRTKSLRCAFLLARWCCFSINSSSMMKRMHKSKFIKQKKRVKEEQIKSFVSVFLRQYIEKQQLLIATIISAWKRLFHCWATSTTWSFLKNEENNSRINTIWIDRCF